MWDAEDVVNPQGRVIDAVADGEIDVAIVWGTVRRLLRQSS
jgi:hypothetical protein